MSVNFTTGNYSGEQGSGNTKCFEKIVAPRQSLEVHELRSAGVGDIGNMNAAVYATGELPDEVAVDVAEGKFAGFGEFTGAVNVVEYPTDFEATEIGGEGKTSLVAEAVLTSLCSEICDVRFNACVLPHNGVINCMASLAIPDNGGFALIGDADRSKVFRLQSFLLHGFFDDFRCSPPDFVRVVLNPPRLRKNLFVLFLRNSRDAARAIEDNEASAGRALIDSANIVGAATHICAVAIALQRIGLRPAEM